MLTNAELRLMADSQPLGPSWIRDALLELLEHRTRAAAHTAAHPERLSEDEIDLLRMSSDDLLSNAPLTHGRLVKAIAEIQQRRAADPTSKKDSVPIADLAHVVRNALTPAAYFLGALLAEDNAAQRIRLGAALEGVNRVLAYVDDLVKAADATPSPATLAAARSAPSSCPHPVEQCTDGPRIPLRWGSAATQICSCGMWRRMDHYPGPWQTAAALVEAREESADE